MAPTNSFGLGTCFHTANLLAKYLVLLLCFGSTSLRLTFSYLVCFFDNPHLSSPTAFISNPYFGFQSDRHKLLLSYTPFVIFCFSFATWIVFYGLVIDYYLVWFIGGNVIVEAAARYIAHIISDSEEQMKSLATYMYSHKKV